jgi:hypothetical protein
MCDVKSWRIQRREAAETWTVFELARFGPNAVQFVLNLIGTGLYLLDEFSLSLIEISQFFSSSKQDLCFCTNVGQRRSHKIAQFLTWVPFFLD